MGYIYKIVNDINDKIYIGQTTRTIQVRWKEHLKESLNIRSNQPIYRAMRKYGNEHFTIDKIEEVDNNQLNEREQYWINYYNTYYNGYNATFGGDGKRIDYTQIFQLWNDGKLITEIAELTNHKRDLISDILKKEYHITQEEIYKRVCLTKPNRGFCKQRKVYKIDKDTNEIVAIFNSIVEAAASLKRENKHSTETCITNVCRGKKKTAYGFKWQYVE